MILNFPDLDTVRLALTAGAVPSAAALAPAVASFGDDGRVWVEPSADLPKKAQAELRRLGVGTARAAGTTLVVEVSCWLEILPLQRSTDPIARPEQTAILFELAEGEQFSSLVSEMLRLGNDRQGFRWLDDPRGKSPGRALLRVVGPPYYSLLRALDRDGSASAPIAFVEQAPRVWVQLGYRHPLGDHLKPPAGKLLLLRPPRRWTCIEDAPFRDIYEVLDFSLPAPKARWREGELERRLTVPLRLTHGGSTDAAALWVLRGNPVEQLDELVREADNALLDRLSFAVGDRKGEKIIVLRVRPSKLAPPALALNAIEFCHFQKMPNLFVPVGKRLHPPLRRDAVRKYLAEDPMQVTWLYPDDTGGFTPESLPETAFRPLSDWIDYVLEHDHEPLQAWIESARFDFEPFICEEEDSNRPKKPPKEPRAKPVRPPVGRSGERKSPAPDGNGDSDKEAGEQLPEDDVYAEVVPLPPDELQMQRLELEERFLAVEGGLDAPERQALWPRLAALNERLGSGDDAGVCWMNALWLGTEEQTAWAWSWFRAEAQGVPLRKETGWPKERTWASAAVLAPRGAPVDGPDLDLVLKLDEPQTADVRALAAHIFWAGCRKEPPTVLVERLARIGHFLETHERLLPVRAAWLAALGLHRLAGGDALGLARTRDRLLERLFHGGLRPEQELPSFLRFSGPAGNQRFRTVRQWLAELAELARTWIREKGQLLVYGKGVPKTEAYVDLLFAFGLAKLGERDACNRLRERAKQALGEAGQAHQFLLEAYEYRIQQALEGKLHRGPLPLEQMEYLALLDDMRKKNKEMAGTGATYVIDRLRDVSRILEPDQEIDPYRYNTRFQNEVEQTLGELPDVLDRTEVAARIHGLLRKVPRGNDGPPLRARVLRAALDQAPRVGEEFSLEMLALVAPAFDALPPPTEAEEFKTQAQLLEKGLFVAAHFDRTESLQQFVARLERLLLAQRESPTIFGFEKVAERCFRGLRKFGMHKEIDQLLQLMARVLLQGRDLKVVEDPEWQARNPAALRTLLHVAAGWYYFGRDGEGEVVLKAARAALLAPLPKPKGDRPDIDGQTKRSRTALAKAYATALSQVPVELAQQRFEELFQKLEGILDNFTTNEYYSQFQIQVVEAVVLAIVSDDFTIGTMVRRWLDDDEFLVRRRIHRDVRELVSHS
jgi:hypothetical protein